MNRRPATRYELFTCGWSGHVLIGTDVAHVSAGDSVVVRQVDGIRWYRCLRCDGWFAHHPPSSPSRDAMPPHSEIAIPLRGPLLRDRYVLRLIALDRALHVLLLAALAVVVFFFAGNHAALQRDYTQIVQAFGGPTRAHGFLGSIGHYFTISTTHLSEAGAGIVFYAALEATEMVGLWFAKRWAEYLTFVATALLLPLEIYELASKVSTLRLVTFVINVAVVAYLLWAKRLFGLNGGQHAEDERRRAAMSWESLEQTIVAPD